MRNVEIDIKEDLKQDIIEIIIKAIKNFDVEWSIILRTNIFCGQLSIDADWLVYDIGKIDMKGQDRKREEKNADKKEKLSISIYKRIDNGEINGSDSILPEEDVEEVLYNGVIYKFII